MIFTWKRACPACRFLPRPRAFSSSCTTARQCPTKARRRFDTPYNQETYARLLKLSGETGYSVGAFLWRISPANPRFDIFPIVGVSRLSQVEALKEAGDAVISLEQAVSLREV